MTTARALFVLLLLALPTRAEEPAATVTEEATREDWEENRHFVTGFGGVTVAAGEKGATEIAPTFGVDYSYRISKLFGVGVFFDATVGPLHELLVGPCLFFFPWRGLFLEASPSLEVEANDALYFAARLAVGYEFELTPQLLVGVYAAADYGHSRLGVVPGLTLGYGF